MGQLLFDRGRRRWRVDRASVCRADADRGTGTGASAGAGRAFSTPTVLHFSVVLFLAAFIRVPWTSITPPSIIGAIVGAGGVIYILKIIREIRAQNVYKPVFEDWLFHVIIPLAAYLTLFILAFVAPGNIRLSLFIGAAATLALLFTGIHNAWDAVTWHVFSRPDSNRETGEQDEQ